MGVLKLWNIKDFVENVMNTSDMMNILAIVKNTSAKQGIMILARL